MKYFAKYLPVEGEIKEGDKKIYRKGAPAVTKMNSEFLEAYNKDPSVSKVKLFLCSRDIQVGDECYHRKYPELGKWAVKEGGAVDCVDWHGENVDDTNLYKVIGEISTDALSYVKEGDKFDKEQLDLIYVPPDRVYAINYAGSVKHSPELGEKGYVILARIKGPCGHFH